MPWQKVLLWKKRTEENLCGRIERVGLKRTRGKGSKWGKGDGKRWESLRPKKGWEPCRQWVIFRDSLQPPTTRVCAIRPLRWPREDALLPCLSFPHPTSRGHSPDCQYTPHQQTLLGPQPIKPPHTPGNPKGHRGRVSRTFSDEESPHLP